MIAASTDQILEGLDPEQREVVTAVRGPVCVIAGAGTGKTRVITHRIAYAIAIGVTDSSKTLALTFTAKAAGEMRARLRGLGIPNATARTFHSAAIKQLMYFWPYSFGGSFPSLLTMKSGAIAEALNRTDSALAPQTSTLREIASEIEWAKVLEISPDEYVESALGAGRRLKIPNNKSDKSNFEDISKVYQAYETLKQQERAIDFEDVLLLTVGMLEEDRDVRERVRDQYRYFTVDEYQDVSPLQQRLLNLWLGDREEICVVGDAAQTIYSFAGASSAFLLGFTKRYPKAQVIRLSRGYRSTPEIISAANAILRQGGMIGEHGHELASMNSHGAKPEIAKFESNASEANFIVNKIAELRVKAGDSAEIAILTRTNSQLDIFERELRAAGIASQIKSSERFFERIDVRDAMRVIRSASVLPTEGGDWYSDLIAVLRPFGDTDYVQAFLALARSMKEASEEAIGPSTPATLRTFLRELEDRAEQNNPPTLPGVVLATLHAAKGLEWDHVFLAGISEGMLPMGEDIEEERRLFYVGLTRAKSELHLSYYGSPSQFLVGIN
ncbi:MAG: ATP-dependent helicase [Actinomycetota bacterium]|jgi:DNA helicase II / ATP-dependent DNA helicase PcrA|tara:strand:+ start:1579 stop:3249 length:1671 start_codon:yes stop_codon:yes gene_type:complete